MARNIRAKFNATAREITRLGHSKIYSATEMRRAEWDLQTVQQRLTRRQYRITSFGQNKFQIADRAADFFAELEFHSDIGRSWGEVFRFLDLSRYRKIADLCPGFGPKVELGLYYAGYRGAVTVVDKNRGALRLLGEFMKLFDTGIKLVNMPCDLFTIKNQTFDLITANHLLDDLIIDWACRRLRIPPRRLYESEETLREVWGYILSNETSVLAANLRPIACAFTEMAAKRSAIVFTHYKSYVERALALKGVSAFNRRIAQGVLRELVAIGWEDRSGELRRELRGHRGQLSARDFYLVQRR
jgi:hypothetical protein